MRLMQEEIFGPILPLVLYASLDEAAAYINARERPLALYLFDAQTRCATDFLDKTASGGVTLNDCLLHAAQDDLPFGGVGPSGMGRYHGHAGFLCFSQQRAVFRQRRWAAQSLLHPPYGGKLAGWIEKIMLR